MKAESPKSSPASTRIAVCSWSLRPEGPDHLLRRLRELHINSVQLALFPLVDESNQWADAIALLRAGGIWISSGMMALAGQDYSRLEGVTRTGLMNDHQWFETRHRAEHVARVAARTGIGLITVQIGPVPHDCGGPEWAKLVDRLRSLADAFADYELDVAIETAQTDAECLAALLDQLNHPHIGVNFDPAGLIFAGVQDSILAFQTLAPRVLQAHVRDAVASAGLRGLAKETRAGRGDVDWNAFFELALVIRPPIEFVIERDPRACTDEDISAARDLIAYHLAPSPHQAQPSKPGPS